MEIVNLFIIIISSLISALTIYFKISPDTLTILNMILLVIIVICFGRIVYYRKEDLLKKIMNSSLIWASSLLIQLFVLKTGGIFSPFLILIHLFTLGSGFLINLKTSNTFLITTIMVLVLQIQLNPTIQQTYQNDPFTAILYGVTFIVIAPLSYLLSSSYRVKDSLYKMLNEYIQVGKQREVSILSLVKEVIIVTDPKLVIVYSNPNLEAEVGKKDTDIARHPFLEVITLKDKSGTPATMQSLLIDQAIADKSTKIINDFYFYGKSKIKVSLQIRPVADTTGKVIQIVIVMTKSEEGEKNNKAYMNLEQAYAKYLSAVEDLRKDLPMTTFQQIRAKFELYNKVIEDIFVAQQLEDKVIDEKVDPQDISLLCKQIMTVKQSLTQIFTIPLHFKLLSEAGEESVLLKLALNSPNSATAKAYVAPINSRWVSILIQKLIDLSLFLSLGQKDAQVTISLQQNNQWVIVEIDCASPAMTQEQQKQLFNRYYGALATDIATLRLGSGLEGYIAKTIADQFSIPLQIQSKVTPQASGLSFILHLKKT